MSDRKPQRKPLPQGASTYEWLEREQEDHQETKAKLETLREVVSQAPHTPQCNALKLCPEDPDHDEEPCDHKPCDCWKATAVLEDP